MKYYEGVEKKQKLTAERFLKQWLLFPFLGVFFCTFANLLLTLLGVTTVESGEGMDVLSNFSEMPFFSIVISCLAAPVLEEFLFRKLLFGKLSKVLPWWAAMLISSVLFGVLHFNVPQGIYGCCFGLILCETMRRTGSWLAPVIVHAAANILSVVMNSVPSWNAWFADNSLWLLIISGVAFLGTFLLFEFLTTEQKTPEHPQRED